VPSGYHTRQAARGTKTQVSLWIAAIGLAVVFFCATLPSPLYPLYRGEFGFGDVTLTLIYAVYVVGNVAALLFFGRLSDQIGRRLVAAAAIVIGIASTLTFLFADGTSWLFAARALSGLSTGLAAGTLTAWLSELDPRGSKAAVLASAANFAGCGVAPVLSGALAAGSPQPLRLPYAVYFGLLVVTGFALLRPRETVADPVRIAAASLRPRLGVPAEIRSAFLAPAVTAFAAFALLGFYAALVPGMLGEHLQQPSPLISGAIVGELFLVSAAAIVVTGRWQSRRVMRGGLCLLLPSLGLLIAAQLDRSLPLLLLATAVAGIAAALGYRGSLEVVNHIAPGDRRAEVVSSYLVTVYCGNSLPVVGVGLLSDWAGSQVAHISFAVVIGLVAIAALAGRQNAERPRTV
jgi:MFS family permease